MRPNKSTWSKTEVREGFISNGRVGWARSPCGGPHLPPTPPKMTEQSYVRKAASFHSYRGWKFGWYQYWGISIEHFQEDNHGTVLPHIADADVVELEAGGQALCDDCISKISGNIGTLDGRPLGSGVNVWEQGSYEIYVLSKLKQYAPYCHHRSCYCVTCVSISNRLPFNGVLLVFKQEADEDRCLKNISLGGLGGICMSFNEE